MKPADTCDGQDDLPAVPVVDMPPDVPALKTFYLYLSAGCNLHCQHCWITPTFVRGKPVPENASNSVCCKRRWRKPGRWGCRRPN